MRARSALSLSLLLCASVACAGDDASADPTEGATVRGTVRDAAKGSRVSGAKVHFVSDTLEEAKDTTNGDGNYALLVVSRSRKGRIEVSKAGYVTQTESVYLDDDDVTVDVDLARK